MTLDLCLLSIHRDLWNSQKWQILISVIRDLDSFLFSEIRDQKRVRYFCCWRKGGIPPSITVPTWSEKNGKNCIRDIQNNLLSISLIVIKSLAKVFLRKKKGGGLNSGSFWQGVPLASPNPYPKLSIQNSIWYLMLSTIQKILTQNYPKYICLVYRIVCNRYFDPKHMQISDKLLVGV